MYTIKTPILTPFKNVIKIRSLILVTDPHSMAAWIRIVIPNADPALKGLK
jgi:hypothetical protein